MNQRNRSIATTTLIAILGLSPTAVAWAAGDGEVEDLRQEVSRLRGQVQALQGAIAEATEIERQRDVGLVSALKPQAAPPQPAAPPAATPVAASDAASEARGASPPRAAAAGADNKRRSASRRHRHLRSTRSHLSP